MKKIFVLFVLIVFIIANTTACANKKGSSNMIQSKRRFAEYVEPQNKTTPGTIDLSEGPKLNYEKKFGPKNLNFDIKIVDPY